MEAIRPYTTHVMPSLKPVNFNYFPLVKNVLKEGLLEHEHIALNTTIYYVTKQQIDNWKFSHKPTTIGLHKQSCKPWKKHSADRQQQNNCLFAHQSYSDPPPPPKKKDSRGHPTSNPSKIVSFWTPPPLPSYFWLPSVCWGGGGGRLRIFSETPHYSGYHKNLIQQLFNIYFRLGGFQSSLLFIYFRYGAYTCSHCNEEW